MAGMTGMTQHDMRGGVLLCCTTWVRFNDVLGCTTWREGRGTSAVAVPDYQTFMRPLLAYGEDGGEKNIREAINALANQFALTEQDRSLLVPSGKETLLSNRVHWARTYLDKAGAITRTRRSHFKITDRGRDLLQKYPTRIDVGVLNQFPEFLAFRTAKHSDEKTHVDAAEATASHLIASVTPDEAIDAAQKEISKNLQSQLLERILEMSPAFFEQLVLNLIVKMGYGGEVGALAERTGGSGDEGFDGIVNQDVLGLDKIYLQAKRYAKDKPVGRPVVQQFAGALSGKGASKGVFMTTSSFSSQAIEFARQVPQRPILIDGEMLTKLMIQHGVAVRTERTIEIKRIDLDYFEEPDE
jgi:restriction system protein